LSIVAGDRRGADAVGGGQSGESQASPWRCAFSERNPAHGHRQDREEEAEGDGREFRA